ncbi:hypothetical protein DFJ58DRAFT_723340 [Suillus subalutaceus]|uniref:uncharacterized protein n=1 Tax=Suillus subalutaceus TaxID=48586 RepID=UPI001B8631A3|nr:uncharacterized protein DFJ58DRAFT_723340 [Suillus subalutaceus]KAG1868931.1 hypothetical protein DFJ58DRAFT_723340 [Suillus subalutaceus]
MNNDLHVFARDGQVYTSVTAHSLPNVIPYEPHWDPRKDHDASSDYSDTLLNTCWVYGARPWFPLIPLNPSFNGPIFGCLNHSRFSLLTEVDNQGKHILHHDIPEKWVELEQKLLLCQECLGAGLLIPWGTELPCPPTTYGLHNVFLLIATTCSWHIMSCCYHGSNCTWMVILTDDPRYPIPAEWVLELTCSFVGDLTTNVPHMGALISSIHCPWQAQLPIFEKFLIPIWVHIPQNTSATINPSLCHYIPPAAAVTRATEPTQWGQDNAWGQLDSSMWGQPEESQNTFKWDDSALG